MPEHPSHSAALPFHRLSSRLTGRVPWSQWYPYLCGSWRGWPAAKPSWGTRRWRWSRREPSENICWRGTRRKERSGKNVKRWEHVLDLLSLRINSAVIVKARQYPLILYFRNIWSWMIKLNTRGDQWKGGKRRGSRGKRSWRRKQEHKRINVRVTIRMVQ